MRTYVEQKLAAARPGREEVIILAPGERDATIARSAAGRIMTIAAPRFPLDRRYRYFADEAALVDTAGRYTTQDSDQAVDSRGWTSFLQLLKKNRPLQPINGIIVAIGVDELIRGDCARIDGHARAVRRRLVELRRTLEVAAPVYVMLTKADLLAGFTEVVGTEHLHLGHAVTDVEPDTGTLTLDDGTTVTGDVVVGADGVHSVVRARVTVAEEISQAQRSDLEQTLSGMSGGKQVAMDVFVDSSIIGGMIVKLGSRMIDGSVRTKLNTLRTRMKEVG